MKPPISYYGGKQRLADTIIELMENVNYKFYTEPFAGGAAVYFNKKPKGHESLNDINLVLYNFYYVCANYPQELADLVEEYPINHKHVRDLALEIYWQYKLDGMPRFTSMTQCNNVNRALPTDKEAQVKLAWSFWYLSQITFNISVIGGYRYRKYHGTVYKRVQMFRNDMSERFKNTIICSNNWKEFMDIYNHSNAMHFIDPPYVGAAHAATYLGQWVKHNFVELVTYLKDTIKGYYVLTCQDDEILKDLNAKVKPTNMHNLAQGHKRGGKNLKFIDEVMVWNFDETTGNKL